MGGAAGTRESGVETVVADDGIVSDNLGPKHPFEFLTRVGSVSAGGNQDGYPVLGNVAKFAEQDWEDGGSGHGPGHVADGDGYGLGLVDKLPEWEGVYWVAERVKDGGFGVGEGGGVVGLNDRGSVGGEVDGQALGPVGQFNAHWYGLSLLCSPSYVTYMLPPGGTC